MRLRPLLPKNQLQGYNQSSCGSLTDPPVSASLFGLSSLVWLDDWKMEGTNDTSDTQPDGGMADDGRWTDLIVLTYSYLGKVLIDLRFTITITLLTYTTGNWENIFPHYGGR